VLYCFQRSLSLPQTLRECGYLTKPDIPAVCGAGMKNIERNAAEFVALERKILKEMQQNFLFSETRHT
tara:strand:- start:346 stop:549 length:204 start_codon:yes stop_codon:yes gene_type:complete